MTANMLVLNPAYADRMGSYVSKFCYKGKEDELDREHEDPSPQTRENTTNAYDEMAGVARQILESVAKQQLTYLTKHRKITKLKEAGDGI